MKVSGILSDIDNLQLEEDEGCRPTEKAILSAVGILIPGVENYGMCIMKYHVAPSCTGGIEVYFQKEERKVHLVVNALGEGPFLYYQEGDKPPKTQTANAETLTDLLYWMSSRDVVPIGT